MATKIWLGTTDSDVTTAGNWSPSGQPTAGDDVVITGTVAIDGATLSSSGNLASFTIRDYSGAIGSESAPLVVDLAASSVVNIDTSGKAYIDFNASDVDVDVFATAATTGTERGLHLSGSGTNSLRAHGSSSVLVLETLDNDIITYSSNVKITTDAAANCTNFIGPGELTANGDVTNIYATGSDVNYYGGAPTLLQAEDGATISYWSAANVTTANAFGGTIELKDSTAARTVTNTATRDGGVIKVGVNWTPTNPPTGGTYEITSA